ncbi:gamma-glutamyltransferase [Leptolyngbya sp. O-77]|uniref:gamma-glutamyltransferase n=1 Tax=Leptolyngbya sp. O-77 TaxID=1080068 RepID=UPI00074D4370|nr:gamma-glutamyltransferase [Leptolyngbya sp. O-77]BAU45046.1 Acylase ACY 1 [Leptolyngbya sp. O-77]
MPAKTRGAIAAGHPKTAEAGAEMLRLRGNAFDAAAAAMLASCVTEPTLTSLGGGGFLLAHTAARQNILFDFFTQTPRQRRPVEAVEFYPVLVDFGTAVQEFHIGLGAIAVPGTVAGLFHMHRRLGRLPMSVVAEPALHYATAGVEMGDFQAYCFRILRPILLACPKMSQLCTQDGELLQAGDRFYNPDLAETIRLLVQEGTQAFYEGDIAHALVKDSQTRGGYLSLEDLRQYRVIERSPLMTRYRGTTLVTNPPPSSGGCLIAFALALLSQVEVAGYEFGSESHLTLLADAMRLTNLARADGYDSRINQPDVAERFLAEAHLHRYAQQLLQTAGVNKWGSTTHFSVIDSEGNAASVTASNGEGSGYTIPGTGIMLNNMLGEADLHPGGFHQWPPDARISSMMAPTMVLAEGMPELVLGSGGSNRIRTAILQVISNVIDFQMPIEQAVNSPRIHWEADVMNLEPGFEVPNIQTRFPWNGKIVPWEQQNMFFGGVHAVLANPDGRLTGAGDRRRSGFVARVE